MLGLGTTEILILLIVGIALVGFLIGIVLLVLYLVRRPEGSRVAELEAENRRLRARLDEE